MEPTLVQVEPVLPVQNVVEAIAYWQEVLGFPDKWMWGNPPTLGAVSWHGAHIQFSHNPSLAVASKGNSIFIQVRHLQTLYEFHKEKGANIVSPLENKPWGMAGYTIRDNNGYYVDFAGQISAPREKSRESLPDNIRIRERLPTPSEYERLAMAVGWMEDDTEEEIAPGLPASRTIKKLAAATHAVVAEDTITGDIVGCALLLGDRISFYYVKDVMVHPLWQGKRIGTAIMKVLLGMVDDQATLTLISSDNLAPFYQQFDFIPTFGMIRFKRVNHEK